MFQINPPLLISIIGRLLPSINELTAAQNPLSSSKRTSTSSISISEGFELVELSALNNVKRNKITIIYYHFSD